MSSVFWSECTYSRLGATTIRLLYTSRIYTRIYIIPSASVFRRRHNDKDSKDEADHNDVDLDSLIFFLLSYPRHCVHCFVPSPACTKATSQTTRSDRTLSAMRSVDADDDYKAKDMRGAYMCALSNAYVM